RGEAEPRNEDELAAFLRIGSQGDERNAKAERHERRKARVLQGGDEAVGNALLGARRGRLGKHCHGGQTFSTSGLPRRPCGRKINVIARMENAATSLYSMEKEADHKVCERPMTIRP